MEKIISCIKKCFVKFKREFNEFCAFLNKNLFVDYFLAFVFVLIFIIGIVDGLALSNFLNLL